MMRNAPIISGAAEVLQRPAVSVARFRVLACAFLLALAGIASRIAWVQIVLPAQFIEPLNALVTEHEVLHARDGRILTESSVLATDVEQYTVEVHYRWIQEPPDDVWLRREVRRRLTSDEYRDEVLRNRVSDEILSERRRLWDSLQLATGVSDDSLNSIRDRITARVEGIAEAVNRARSAASDRRDSPATDELGYETEPESGLLRLAAWIRSSMSAEPDRQPDRIVVREEEDFHTLLEDVSRETAVRIFSRPHEFPGTRVSTGSRRVYLRPEFAPHIVGARTDRRPDERSSRESDSDSRNESELPPAERARVGRFGVEHTFDRRISGVTGLRRIVRNRRNEIVRSEIVREPVAGSDLMLTLNDDLQSVCETLLDDALHGRPITRPPADAAVGISESLTEEDGTRTSEGVLPSGGCAVVMEAATGRIVAAASAPRFSLDLFTGADDRDWEQARNDARRPFFCRTTSMALPPGSAFKPVIAAAALQYGVSDSGEAISCRGYLESPDRYRCLIFRRYGVGHGELTLEEALSRSCNVFFFELAERLTLSQIRETCRIFGIGERTGVDLPFEQRGSLPGASEVSGRGDSDRGTRLGLSIGQSGLTVTPLQMARCTALIANGGTPVIPRVTADEGGRSLTDSEAAEPDRAGDPQSLRGRISASVLEPIRRGMFAAINEPGGTGYRTIRLADPLIAGKTGTAEAGGNRPDHAWFVGYWPADAPRWVIVVVLEHGGGGGTSAGPVAREIIRSTSDIDL